MAVREGPIRDDQKVGAVDSPSRKHTEKDPRGVEPGMDNFESS